MPFDILVHPNPALWPGLFGRMILLSPVWMGLSLYRFMAIPLPLQKKFHVLFFIPLPPPLFFVSIYLSPSRLSFGFARYLLKRPWAELFQHAIFCLSRMLGPIGPPEFRNRFFFKGQPFLFLTPLPSSLSILSFFASLFRPSPAEFSFQPGFPRIFIQFFFFVVFFVLLFSISVIFSQWSVFNPVQTS